MRGNARSYDELRDYIAGIPLVDCHDHTGAGCGPRYADALQMVMGQYLCADLNSASSDADLAFMSDANRSIEERWPVFEKAWRRTCHTGYAQVTRRVLKKFFGEDEVTLEALRRINEKLPDLENAEYCESILEEAKILVRLEDVWPPLDQVINGTLKTAPRTRLVISLPAFHNVPRRDNVDGFAAVVGRRVTALDEYLDVCRTIFEAYKKLGAVAFKDQSAYSRTLDYGNPTRAQAEEVFNWFMEDPRRCASYPDGVKPLDDYLFHEFMRMARDMDLPVQIHTGAMAGIRNDIVKTNAIGLTRLIELHRDVRFDLFHANWPYAGELLHLGKNYPNVAIDFCWANIVDPIYSQNLLKQVISSVPHGKVHGYGSDFLGYAERAWAHSEIARDNIAIALSDLVDLDYLGVDDAREIADGWLFDNANRFFGLGIER